MTDRTPPRVEGRPVFVYQHPDDIVRGWFGAIKRAGIKRLTPHSCRHGFATGLLRKGVDVVTVAKLGGWKSAQHLFNTYLHASDDATITDKLFDTSSDTAKDEGKQDQSVKAAK